MRECKCDRWKGKKMGGGFRKRCDRWAVIDCYRPHTSVGRLVVFLLFFQTHLTTMLLLVPVSHQSPSVY